MPRPADSVRAVAFDLDGTLVDSAPDLAAAVNAMLADLGHLRLPQDRIEALIGLGVEFLVESALAESAHPSSKPVKLAAAVDLFAGHYARAIFVRSRVYPGVVEGLEALRAAGMSLGCITNKRGELARALLEAAGLARHMDFVLCAEHAEERKPAPYLLLAAARRLGIDTEAMLYVGDSRVDMVAASAAGCPFAAVAYGYSQGLRLTDGGPMWLVPDIADLARRLAASSPALVSQS